VERALAMAAFLTTPSEKPPIGAFGPGRSSSRQWDSKVCFRANPFSRSISAVSSACRSEEEIPHCFVVRHTDRYKTEEQGRVYRGNPASGYLPY